MAISTHPSIWPDNSTNVRAETSSPGPRSTAPGATRIREERDPAFRAWASEVVQALDGPLGVDLHAAAGATAGRDAPRPTGAGAAAGGGVGGVAGGAPPPQEDPGSTTRESASKGSRGPAVPWYLRAGFSALGTVAPPLAAAWAEQLFCTAPRYPVPASEAAALATAHAGSVIVNGQRLATWTWGQGPTVLLVHGWGGRGGQLHGFVPGLLAAGFSVVAFDGPGHGASEGKTSSLVEHGRAVAGVAAALPSRVHAVVAHSMGGAAAGLAFEAGLEVEAAVFVAPPFAAGHWVAPFATALGLADKVRDGMVRRVEDRLQVRFDELTMARTAPLMTAPLLVIHDLDDKEVPHASGAGIVARWPGATLHTTKGLGHKRILGDAEVIARGVAFVRR